MEFGAVSSYIKDPGKSPFLSDVRLGKGPLSSNKPGKDGVQDNGFVPCDIREEESSIGSSIFTYQREYPKN